MNKNPPATTTFENKEVLEQPSRNVPWQRPRPVHEGQLFARNGSAAGFFVEVMVGWKPPPKRGLSHPKHLQRFKGGVTR